MRCDLTKFRQGLLATARNHLKDNELKGYTYNNAECSLVLKDAESGNRMFYKSLAEFKTFAAGLGRGPPSISAISGNPMLHARFLMPD